MWKKIVEKNALVYELPHMSPSYGYYKTISVYSLWILNGSTWTFLHFSNFPLFPKTL